MQMCITCRKARGFKGGKEKFLEFVVVAPGVFGASGGVFFGDGVSVCLNVCFECLWWGVQGWGGALLVHLRPCRLCPLVLPRRCFVV